MSNYNIDYETMSTEDLSREREIIDALIIERHEKEKQALLTEFHQRARTLGIDLTELIGGRRPGGRGEEAWHGSSKVLSSRRSVPHLDGTRPQAEVGREATGHRQAS